MGVAVALAGCTGTVTDRLATADNIAANAGMARIELPAGAFGITGYVRRAQSATLRLYLEGDGAAWDDPGRPPLDPTPRMPTALALASRDPAPLVGWLARPCQYRQVQEPACTDALWTRARFSETAIAALDRATDRLMAQTGATRLELVGHSGGGAVAVLLAARRRDVVALRTVAGTLDAAAWTRLHGVSALSDSLEPAGAAARLTMLPQRHFVGGADGVMPEAIARSYLAHLGDTRCAALTRVGEAGHLDGWVERWPALLAEALPCSSP